MNGRENLEEPADREKKREKIIYIEIILYNRKNICYYEY